MDSSTENVNMLCFYLVVKISVSASSLNEDKGIFF